MKLGKSKLLTQIYSRFFKRVFDILGSVLLMPFVLPIVLLYGLLIKFEDRGPMFYIADRLGKNGTIFKMYKLRSMKMNAPDIRNPDGSTFSSANDERLTKWGKFVREKSIDELPQIFNVFIGNMSFIGPRPNIPSPYNELTKIEKERLRVRSGITGYNQAYFRNFVSKKQKFTNDVYYIKHISFALDIKILIKTFLAVLKRENIHTTIADTAEKITDSVENAGRL
ncbi:MAG: sugar transferase [Saccharofermentanales bacterium]